MKEDEYLPILNKVISYCAYSERCWQDVGSKIKPFHLDEQTTTHIRDYLTEFDIVNEKRFAESFALGKMRYNRWGRIKIRSKLYAKGILQQDIQNGIESLDELEYLSILQNVIRRKLERTSSDGYAKAIRYAQSKGFEMSLAVEVMKSCYEPKE